MKNQKLFTVYIINEIGEVDLNTHIDFNLGELIPENKVNEILKGNEVKQIQDIVLNVCKRVNKINGVDELRRLDIEPEKEDSQKFIVSCVNLGKELIDKEELTKREEEFINNLDVIIDKYFR